MKVTCEIEEAELEGDFCPVRGVVTTCSRYGHCTESYGTSSASVRRCLAVMREECPQGGNNFYVADDGSDRDEPPVADEDFFLGEEG